MYIYKHSSGAAVWWVAAHCSCQGSVVDCVGCCAMVCFLLCQAVAALILPGSALSNQESANGHEMLRLSGSSMTSSIECTCCCRCSTPQDTSYLSSPLQGTHTATLLKPGRANCTPCWLHDSPGCYTTSTLRSHTKLLRLIKACSTC